MAVEPGHELQVDLAPSHGRQVEQRSRLGWHPFEAPVHNRLDATGKDACRKGHSAHIAQAAGLLGQGADHLDQEEGIAFGLALQEGQHFGPPSCLAQDRAAQFGDLGLSQPLQLDDLHARQPIGQLGHLVVPIAADDDQRQAGQEWDKLRQQVKALAGPMQILEDEQGGCRLPEEGADDGSQQALLAGLSGQLERVGHIALQQ